MQCYDLRKLIFKKGEWLAPSFKAGILASPYNQNGNKRFTACRTAGPIAKEYLFMILFFFICCFISMLDFSAEDTAEEE